MDDFCYGIVGNIPSELRSADLRAFFSQFIESKGFLCFHFRHRPEVQRSNKTDLNKSDKNGEKTCCCIIKVYKHKMDELIRMYSGQNWTNSVGKLLNNKVLISKIKVGKENEDQQRGDTYQTRQEKQQATRTVEEFVEGDLKKLLEMNPPQIMPNGNVGTPLTVFIELIRECKFPPHLIKKLGLSFPRSKKKKYGNVPFDYKILDAYGRTTDEDDKYYDDNKRIQCDQSSEEVTSQLNENNTDHNDKEIESQCNENRHDQRTGHHVLGGFDAVQHSSHPKMSSHSFINRNTSKLETSTQTKDSSSNSTTKSKANKSNKPTTTCYLEHDEDSDSELEEWDRHAALNNDITSQERTKERLYEDNIELKWEKGGSGLVWYTDAAFWKQQEEADFDEETTDDWDVDMSIYEEEGAGDLDAKTSLQLRVEQEWKCGKNIDLNRVGGFEKHTRGFGGHIMKKQGWTVGQSLGSSQTGITEPLPNDGQHPSSKRGLGFYGEKLNRVVKRPRPTREAVISTIYDKVEDRNSELFQSGGPYNIKYRDKVDFVPKTET